MALAGADRPVAGSVWIAERNHPDVPASKNRLWLLNTDGTVRRKLDLGERDVFAVGFQRGKGEAWISGYNSGLQRVPGNGEPDQPLPFVARSISISPAGDLWIATAVEVLRIDATGKVLARSPFRKKSLQSWLTAL